MDKFYVYIITNTHNTVFYTGSTNNLNRRLSEHKRGKKYSFTKKYNVWKLIYYEILPDKTTALHREIQIKKYSRFKKFRLISQSNQFFKELKVS